MEFFVVIHTLQLNKSCLEIQVRSYAYQVNFVDHPASLKKITCLRNTVYLKVFTGRYSNFVGLYQYVYRYMYCLRACTDAVMNIIHLVYLMPCTCICIVVHVSKLAACLKTCLSAYHLYHQRSLNKCRFTYKYYQFVALLNI